MIKDFTAASPSGAESPGPVRYDSPFSKRAPR